METVTRGRKETAWVSVLMEVVGRPKCLKWSEIYPCAMRTKEFKMSIYFIWRQSSKFFSNKQDSNEPKPFAVGDAMKMI